jgi:hypothetical protein
MIINALPTFNSNFSSITLISSEDEKKVFKIDPLACAVSLKRNNKPYGLVDNIDHVSQDDFEQANIIRAYYKKKFFWKGLSSSHPATQFRTLANQLLEIEKDWNITEKEAGVFVKLPYFYEEDLVYDSFVTVLLTKREDYAGTAALSVTKNLHFLNKTFKWQHVKRVAYWFKDEANHLYCFNTAYDHPFNPLFEEKIVDPLTFEFACGVDNIGTMWYNTIKSFTILKETNA